jgi:hypothetical protein
MYFFLVKSHFIQIFIHHNNRRQVLWVAVKSCPVLHFSTVIFSSPSWSLILTLLSVENWVPLKPVLEARGHEGCCTFSWNVVVVNASEESHTWSRFFFLKRHRYYFIIVKCFIRVSHAKSTFAKLFLMIASFDDPVALIWNACFLHLWYNTSKHDHMHSYSNLSSDLLNPTWPTLARLPAGFKYSFLTVKHVPNSGN